MFTPKVLMELFGVTNHTLRKWRYAKPKSQHYLPAIADIDNPTKVYYTVDAVKEFLRRNPKYMDRVAAAWAPVEIHCELQAIPQATVQALRGKQVGPGLLASPITP